MPAGQDESSDNGKPREELLRVKHPQYAWFMRSNGWCRRVEMRNDGPVPIAADDPTDDPGPG